MSRSKYALPLACALSISMSTALARDVERLSAADAGGDCPAELAAAKAAADAGPAGDPARSAKPSPAPVRGKPSVRGGDATSVGTRLGAPRWHSFLPGMFR